ncbi:cytochrome C [Pseudoalteromonas sp. NBT06-2]|uniref:c-type cytochrome n=1 Tax=Pseudoalteromonas sp. NBT06-2 TaxID=2025950 RepID=UPI000BA75CB9|nr:cytochrome c [Pseudoalteromonas sp. NBT06-2]PAJ73874.1 cytochrome C [Pseudoalteromonas sp. NBT06-2]
MIKKLLIVSGLALTTINTQAADVAAGKAKSGMCAACHGAAGISSVPMYPNLAGQKAVYLEKQLKAFKSGVRKDPVMAPMSMGLSDADMANISAYYASLK